MFVYTINICLRLKYFLIQLPSVTKIPVSFSSINKHSKSSCPKSQKKCTNTTHIVLHLEGRLLGICVICRIQAFCALGMQVIQILNIQVIHTLGLHVNYMFTLGFEINLITLSFQVYRQILGQLYPQLSCQLHQMLSCQRHLQLPGKPHTQLQI